MSRQGSGRDYRTKGGDGSGSGLVRSLLRRVLQDVGLAFGLLTRFPLPPFSVVGPVPLARAAWVFPIAGAVIGVVGALGFEASRAIGFDDSVAVVVALLLMVVCGGGLHEDGLADFWDGLGGGHDPQTRLEIMRDSRIGSYGVLALGFVLVLQGLLLVAIAQSPGGWPMWCVIIGVSAMTRAAILVPMGFLEPARESGLGVQVAEGSKFVMALGVVFGCAISFWMLGFAGALIAALGALVMSGLVCLLAWRYLGGQTGDVLGAAASMSVVGSLAALVIGAAMLFPAGGAHP